MDPSYRRQRTSIELPTDLCSAASMMVDAEMPSPDSSGADNSPRTNGPAMNLQFPHSTMPSTSHHVPGLSELNQLLISTLLQSQNQIPMGQAANRLANGCVNNEVLQLLQAHSAAFNLSNVNPLLPNPNDTSATVASLLAELRHTFWPALFAVSPLQLFQQRRDRSKNGGVGSDETEHGTPNRPAERGPEADADGAAAADRPRTL
uniref:Uncharacterized protein n=1 Tax=Panagrolaimus sp. JU765 TaxID=591449 RepID=A0AC34QFX4_9BILA